MPRKEKKYTNVGPNLYRSPDEFYHACRKIDYQKVWEPLGTQDPLLARQLCRKWMSDTDANPPPKNRDITVRGAFELTLAEIKRQKPRSYKVRCSHAQMIYKACTWEGGADILFSELTSEQCNIIFNRIADPDGVQRAGMICWDKRKPALYGKPIGASSYNDCHSLATRVCRERRIDGFRVSDPMEQARIPRLPKDKIDRQTPSIQQAKAIVAYVRRHKNARSEESADFIELAYECGLGGAEIVELTYGVVRYEVGAIHVTRVKTDHEFDIPFYKWSHDLWNRLLERAIARNGGEPPGPDVKVFNIKSPAGALRAACKALGLPNFSLRAMRRVFIYLCCWGGIPREQVAALQGHQDHGELIEEVYDNARCESDDVRLAARMAGIVNGLGKVEELYGCQNTPELIHPSRAKALPEGLRHSEKLERRLAQALAEAERSYVERQQRCMRAKWAKEAKSKALPYDPEADFKDQDARLKSAIVTPMHAGARMDYEAQFESILEAGNLEVRQKEQQRLRSQAQGKISKLMAVIRGGVRDSLIREIETEIRDLQVQVDEAESALSAISSAKKIREKRAKAAANAAPAQVQGKCA